MTETRSGEIVGWVVGRPAPEFGDDRQSVRQVAPLRGIMRLEDAESTLASHAGPGGELFAVYRIAPDSTGHVHA